MGFILFGLAYFLMLPMTLINFIVVRDWGYFKDTAISIDIFANREYRATWNKLFRKENGELFGEPGVTISAVLGINQANDTLTNVGWIIVYILDLIETGHSLKAADLPYDKNDKKLLVKKLKAIWLRIKIKFISLFST